MGLNLTKILAGVGECAQNSSKTAAKAVKKAAAQVDNRATFPRISGEKLQEAYMANKGIKIVQSNVDAVYKKLRPRIIKPKFHPNWEIVDVKTSAFEKLFESSNPSQYIGKPGHIQVPKRYERLKELFASTQDIEAPEVYVQMEKGLPIIKFDDGRHRYAVMRDMGLKTIPVAMDKDSIRIAKKAGLI